MNLAEDPSERRDLSEEDPAHGAVAADLRALLADLNAGAFAPDRGAHDPAACDAALRNGAPLRRELAERARFGRGGRGGRARPVSLHFMELAFLRRLKPPSAF